MAPGRAFANGTSITRPAVLASLPDFQSDVAACAARSGLDAQRTTNLALALEEVFVNICRYAYPEVDGLVTLSCGATGDDFIVELIDDGQPFDPSIIAEPDLGADLNARPIGGLGWFLARRLVDQLEYRRDDGRNLIRLTMHRRQGPSQ